ncbi:MAG: T9SS type A sorting domain-containing protein [Bacteroidota bacterium]|nr:T9SS type A sorting domain-containing protein [Bacteroidota bacterium]
MKENEDDCFQTSVGIGTVDEKMGMQVFPNPASDYILLQSEITLDKAGFQLLSVHGGIVIRDNMDSDSKKIDIAGLPPGVYLIQFEQAGLPVLKIL